MNRTYYGRWNIEAMDVWEREHIDLVEPGHITFEADGSGKMVWGALTSTIRGANQKESSVYEFSWEGFDEGDPVDGTVRIEFLNNRMAKAQLKIHNGESSGMVLSR